MNIRLTIFCIILIVIGYYVHNIITPEKDCTIKEKISLKESKNPMDKINEKTSKQSENKTKQNVIVNNGTRKMRLKP
jgi:hypothetical protein